MVVTFEDEEQLEYISNFVNLVSGIYAKSSVSTLKALANKLHGAYTDKLLNVDLDEYNEEHRNDDQLYCLYSMCDVLNRIGADEVNAGIDMYDKLKEHYTESDVPQFLEVLRDYHVPAEYCTELFKYWCNCEGIGSMANECMNIQANHNIVMTPVWEWLLNNAPSPDTDYHVEMNKYKEAINGCN